MEDEFIEFFLSLFLRGLININQQEKEKINKSVRNLGDNF